MSDFLSFSPKTTVSVEARGSWKVARGFTLIEMLMVIIIVTMMMTVVVLGVKNVTGGKGTVSAVASSEALFAEARGLAVGRGGRTRVLVDVGNPEGNETYLRRAVVVYENDGGVWTPTGRAYQFPSGVYFSEQFSQPTVSEELSLHNEAGVESSSGRWAVYEFNSQGVFRSSGANPVTAPGAFIVAAGQRSGGQQRPRLTAAGARDFDGFVIWRSGRTAKYQNPEQMGAGVAGASVGDPF